MKQLIIISSLCLIFIGTSFTTIQTPCAKDTIIKLDKVIKRQDADIPTDSKISEAESKKNVKCFFSKIDNNKDGFVTIEELTVFDTDGNGKITKEEFENYDPS